MAGGYTYLQPLICSRARLLIWTLNACDRMISELVEDGRCGWLYSFIDMYEQKRYIIDMDLAARPMLV